MCVLFSHNYAFLRFSLIYQAAKTAVIIAKQEQELGNYKQAHSILFETIKLLEEHKVGVGVIGVRTDHADKKRKKCSLSFLVCASHDTRVKTQPKQPTLVVRKNQTTHLHSPSPTKSTKSIKSINQINQPIKSGARATEPSEAFRLASLLHAGEEAREARRPRWGGAHAAAGGRLHLEVPKPHGEAFMYFVIGRMTT